MLNFIFYNPTKIYFGKGQVSCLGEELRERASVVLMVSGRGSIKANGIYDDVIGQVGLAGVELVELSGVCPNPRLSVVKDGISICRKERVDFILAVGGGSVIDAAKAIAAGARYDGDVWDFFETGARPRKAIPVGTVLTVAATGTEMNPNTVITNEEQGKKYSFGSDVIRPVFSILDPVYTFTVNKMHTAAGVADIMAHVFEYYLVPLSGSGLQDSMAEAVIKTCIEYAPLVMSDPCDYVARANILWASTMALNGTIGRGKISDWVLHAIEHKISAIYDISHGQGLAIILPAFMAMTARRYGEERLESYGRNVWGLEGDNIPDRAIEKTRQFFNSLGLPSRLEDKDISDEYFDQIADDAVNIRPRLDELQQLTKNDIIEVLKNSI